MDYIINVRAELDANSESNLKKELGDIKSNLESQKIKIKIGYEPDEKFDIFSIKQKIEKERITLKISDVQFDKKGAESSIEKTVANVKTQVQNTMSKINVTGFNKSNYESLLATMGLDKKSISQAVKDIQNLGITITKISGTDYGTDNKGNNTISALIQGEDKFGRIVNLTQKIKVSIDESGEEVASISNQVINVTDNIKKQVQEQEKLNKAYYRQKDILEEEIGDAKELWAVQKDRKNPIQDVEMGIVEDNGITTLSYDLDKLTPKTKEFVKSYDEWVKAIQKANNELETQRSISNETLNELTKTRLAAQTASRNAISERTTQTDFRTKDVTAEIEKAKEELKTFETKIAKVGLTLKDLAGDSSETLRDILDGVSDSEGFAKYLDQLGIAKAKFKNLEEEIKSENKAFEDYKKSIQELISLNEKIATQEKKVIDAEYSGKPQETIDLLKDGLEDLKSTYDRLVSDFVSNPLFEQMTGEDLSELEKSVVKIEQLAESRKAEHQQRQDEKLKKEYYQEQLRVQNEIDKLIAEQNRLSADANNTHQRELKTIVQKLEILEQQKEELDELAKGNLSEESYLENQNRLLQAGNDKLEERKRLRSQIYDSVESKANSTYDSFATSINKTHFDKNLGQGTGGSAITSDVDKLNQLKDAYWNVVDALNALKASTTNQQLKNNTEAVEEAIKEYNDLAEAIKNVDNIGSSLSKLKSQTDKGLFSQNSDNEKVTELKSEIQEIANEYEKLNGTFKSEGMSVSLSKEFQSLNDRIKNASNNADVLKKELRETKAATSLLDKKNALSNKIEMWLKNNTKATKAMKQSMRELQNQIESADGAKLTSLQQEFKKLNGIAHETDQIGKNLKDTFKEKLGKFSAWFGLANMVMTLTNNVKQSIVELKEVDTILTEISKTSDMTEQELKELGETAFESASQYGVTVQSFLTGVQEMSRAGYGAASESMAELSILAQSAGDMTAQVANDYLIATDAAYQLKGSQEELGKVLDGQNLISNNYAVSLTDMAEATKEAASTAAEYGVSIEQLSALITMAVSKTRQSGSEAGTAINALMLNLTDITNKERMKAFDDLGVSVYKFTNGVKQVKTPIELLGELSDVLKSLSEGDERINELFNDIGGRNVYHYVQKCA